MNKNIRHPGGCLKNSYFFNINDTKSFTPVCKLNHYGDVALKERLQICLAQVGSFPYFVSSETLSVVLETTPLKVVNALGKLRRDNVINYSYLRGVNLFAIESVSNVPGCSCPFGFVTCSSCLFLRGCQSGACSMEVKGERS